MVDERRSGPGGEGGEGAGGQEGPARPPARAALIVLVLAAAVYAAYLARTDFHVLPREDTMEAVAAARELAAGRGFTTRAAVPSMVAGLAERGREDPPWPSATRAPLPVMAIAALTHVTSEPTAVALSSGVFFVLSVPLVFLLGDRLGGRGAGALAACGYTLSPAGLWYGVTGLTESSTIFALAAVAYLFTFRLTWPVALAAGGAVGIGYLGRSTMMLWAPLMVLFVLWRSWDAGWLRAVGRALMFCIPLIIAMVWWGLQMQHLAGEFGYSAQQDISTRRDTGLYPGRGSSHVLESWGTLEFIRAHPGVMARKYARIAERAWPDFVTMGGMALLVALFVAEMVVVLAGGKRVRLHWLVYALAAEQLLLLPLASYGHGGVSVNRYLDPLGPLCATLGAAFGFELLRRYGASMRLAVIPLGLIVALMAVPTLFDLAVGPYHQEALERARTLAGYLSSHGSQDDVVVSTHHALVAWSPGMYAIGLPLTPEQFLRMHEQMVPADWVHIKHRPGNRGMTVAWEPIMAGEQPLPGFEIVKRFDDGGVLLRRTDRS
ncbi:MAG: hypothetical protein U9R79_08385 [Armatimonadota bacterium]|nr:hypothetical protein [Armatimonadota bacterium]